MTSRWRKLSITQRLFLLTAIALLPGAISLVFLVSSWHQAREREIHDQALRYGQLAALEMERIISGAEATLKAIAGVPLVRSFDSPACSQYLAAIGAELPQFAAVSVVDTTGLLRCRTEMPSTTIRIDDRPYFRAAVGTRDLVVGEYTKSAITGMGVLPLAFAMRGSDGTVVGVLVAALNLDWLGARLKDRDFAQGGALTIADRTGVIIAREPFPERFVGTRIPDQFQYLVRGDRPGTLEVTSQDGTRRVIGYHPAAHTSTGLYVSAGVSTEAFLRQLYMSTYRSAAIGLAGALVAFVIAWFTGDRLFKQPIDRLLATVGAWRRGDHSARTRVGQTGDELSALAHTIDVFMDELMADRAARQRAEEHRDLVAKELDHRIKNMLATVQAIASQSFSGPMMRERLQAFMGRLSAMAAVHNMLMSEAWVSAELRSVITSALQPFDQEKQQRFFVEGPDLIIGARAALALSMAIHELCTNAVKYGALRETDGRVFLAWRIEGDEFVLSWTERGGPRVEPPETTGFGTKMIERALALEISGNVQIQFSATGVVCRIQCPLGSISVDGKGPHSAQEAA